MKTLKETSIVSRRKCKKGQWCSLSLHGKTAIEVVIINQCHRQQKTNTHTFDSVRTKNQRKEDRGITSAIGDL